MNPRSLQVRAGTGRPPLMPWPAARAAAEERARTYRRHGAPCADCSVPPVEYVYHSAEKPCPWRDGSRRWRVARWVANHPEIGQLVALIVMASAAGLGLSFTPPLVQLWAALALLAGCATYATREVLGGRRGRR